MKKVHLILIASIIFSTTVFGQSKQLNIGVEFGPSYTFLWNDDFISEQNHPTDAYVAGVTFQYNITRLFSLRSNIFYERKGTKSTANIRDNQGNFLGSFTVHNNLNYLTLPVLARLSLGNRMKFFINAGPYIGFLMKQTYVHEAYQAIPEQKYDGTKTYQTIDLGLSGGLGFTIPFSDSFIISLEARNNLGLYNVSKSPIISEGEFFTNSTNLLLGFAYQFGKAL
jgi:hypothetical protein